MIYMFDFDGTLVDSMPYWSRKVLNILDFHKVSYPDDIIKTLATLGDMGTIKYMKEHFGVNASEADILAMMDEYALPKYRDVIGFKNKYQLTAVKNPCPHDGITRREYVKNLIRQIQKDNPEAKQRMFNAILKGKIYQW